MESPYLNKGSLSPYFLVAPINSLPSITINANIDFQLGARRRTKRKRLTRISEMAVLIFRTTKESRVRSTGKNLIHVSMRLEDHGNSLSLSFSHSLCRKEAFRLSITRECRARTD